MKITTVCGDIAPEELGFTLIHEHVIQDITALFGDMRPIFPWVKDEQLTLSMENLQFLQSGAWMLSKEAVDVQSDAYLDFIINELKLFKEAGGKSLCECSVYGLTGRPYEDLIKISKATGVNIIHGVGLYTKHTRPAEYMDMGEDEIKELFEKTIREGFETSGILPGFVKAAFSGLDEDGHFKADEMDVYRACARVSAEHNLPILVHTQALTAENLVELAELVKSLGADIKKLNFCHTDSIIAPAEPLVDYIRDHEPKFDIESYKKILDTGVNISFDGIGNAVMFSMEFSGQKPVDDYTRVSAIYELIKLGYEDQIMLGHDFTCKISGVAYGGYGYTRVPNFVCSMLKQLGCEDAAYKMTVINPARFLAHE